MKKKDFPKSLLNISLEQYGVRSCNITKEMLYWPHDQTITDRICRSSLSPHLKRKCQAGDLLWIPGLTTDWILSQFGKEQKKASNRYQAFVRSGIKAESPLKAIKGQLFFGQENFIEEIKPLYYSEQSD